ncbi:MAG: response regulator, partial [Pseudomonadota bacterium]|nr:response regulator [Pseudomonadota bacterium]
VEAKLARLARLKDEFLANMSHELRTPLNAILGIAEAFQEEIYGPVTAKQRRFLTTLEESGQHLLALINDILDFSRIEANKLNLKMRPVAIEGVCQASLRMIQGFAYKKRLQVSSTLDTTFDMIQADERRLKQILVNLLDNAVKFTPERGHIELEVNGNAEHNIVEFHVRDSGMGIAPADMEHLFDAFVQLDGGLNRAHEGTGLGLSLVYQLTQLHGGSVSVSSQVGQGSCFTVTLPWGGHQRRAHLKSMSAVASPRYPPPLAATLLVAEDNEMNLETLSSYLSTKGYQVLTARDGIEAIEQAKAKQPQLILMDIQMPVMNGLEAIREIRAQPQIAKTPIIALTALVRPGDRERCLRAGANDYLSKPVKMKKLLTMIEAHLRMHSKMNSSIL